jgi:hypothetical protein
MEYEPVDTSRMKRSALPLLLLALLAFLLGLAAMGWLLANWDAARRLVGIEPAVVAAPAMPAAAAQPLPQAVGAPEPQRLLVDPELQRRVNRLEQRLAGVESQSRAAVGNADRAEGLLVAFAARRALDRGVGLGYIEGLLGQRFGDTHAQAVGTVITAARQPVTLEELQEELQEIGPRMTGAGPDQGWWTALQSELGSLITVRRQGTPSTIPAERLRRAIRRIEVGQVDVALAEVMRLPGRSQAAEWIARARRYVMARRALDAIETAALLDPQRPPVVTAPQAAAPAPRPR